MDMSKHARNVSLDVMKGIACIAVVLIHYNYKGELGACVKAACRFAVPFFFFVSGYYLKLNRLGKSIRHLVNLEIFATLFYLVYFILFEYFWRRGKMPDPAVFCEKHLSAAKVVKFLVQNDGFFNVMLWFIGALIACYAVIALWFRTEALLRKAFWLIVPLWVMMCVCQEFSAALNFRWSFWQIPGVSNNSKIMLFCLFPFRALPFFLFGAWIRRHQYFIERLRIKGWIFLSGIVLGSGLAIGEYYMLGHRSCQFYIGSYITGVLMLMWAIRSPYMRCPFLAYCGYKLSMYVYVLQLAASKTIDIIARNNGWWGTSWYKWSYSSMVLLLSFCLAFCAHFILNVLPEYILALKDKHRHSNEYK